MLSACSLLLQNETIRLSTRGYKATKEGPVSNRGIFNPRALLSFSLFSAILYPIQLGSRKRNARRKNFRIFSE
jgi:hypothetical protein